MSHPMLMIHNVTAITSQRIIYDTFTEIKLKITDDDGEPSYVSLMSKTPVTITELQFRDSRKAEAVPA